MLNQFNEKIDKDKLILMFFKEYFEFCYVILDVIGVDFSFVNDVDTRCIYIENRSTFKLFIDFYKFLNPFEEEDQKNMKTPNLSKLSRMKTNNHEEKKKVEFESEKIENIFVVKVEVDLSLKTILCGLKLKLIENSLRKISTPTGEF